MSDESRQPATGYPVHPPPPHPTTTAVSNGYFQQPPPPYACPLQPPPPPPPTHRVTQKTQKCIECLICVIAVSILIGLFVIIWLICLALSPDLPGFRVDSATLTGFNLTNSTLSGAWDFRVTATNPNKKYDILFNEVTTELAYGVSSLVNSEVEWFALRRRLRRRSEMAIRVSFSANESTSYMSDGVKWALSRDRNDDGFVGFDVRIYPWVLFDGGIFTFKRRMAKVLCRNVEIPIGSGGSGNMTGGPKPCRIDL